MRFSENNLLICNFCKNIVSMRVMNVLGSQTNLRRKLSSVRSRCLRWTGQFYISTWISFTDIQITWSWRECFNYKHYALRHRSKKRPNICAPSISASRMTRNIQTLSDESASKIPCRSNARQCCSKFARITGTLSLRNADSKRFRYPVLNDQLLFATEQSIQRPWAY